MSQEEQDAILARSVRRQAELSRELAAIQIKLSEFGKAGEKLSFRIKDVLGTPLSIAAMRVATDAVEALLEKEDALKTLADWRDKFNEKIELDERVKQLSGETA